MRRLRELEEMLRKYGMKQMDLAEEVGISNAAISKIIAGVNRPRPNTIQLIADAVCRTDEERCLVIKSLTYERPEGASAAEAAFLRDVEEKLDRNGFELRSQSHPKTVDLLIKGPILVGVNCLIPHQTGPVRGAAMEVVRRGKAAGLHSHTVCVPYINETAKELRKVLAKHEVGLVAFNELVEALRDSVEQARVPISLPACLIKDVKALVQARGIDLKSVFPKSVRKLPGWEDDLRRKARSSAASEG